MNRTQSAVQRQLQAFGCRHYQLGIRGPDGQMLPREWDPKTIGRSLGWLRLMNRQSHDIYIRPAGSLGIVLLDDLEHAALGLMSRDGFPPALVVQTSPANYQAWVRLISNQGNKPIDPGLLTGAARELATRYHGDPCSADWKHLGRLAGFTNRKPCHPATACSLMSCCVKLAAWLLLWAVACSYLYTPSRQPRHHWSSATHRPPPYRPLGPYAARLRALCVNLGLSTVDLSRSDLMIARDMVREGHDPQTINRILVDSPNPLCQYRVRHDTPEKLTS